MPFKNYEELISMADRNASMARKYVSRAKQMGKPVVSSNNPGYNEETGETTPDNESNEDYRGNAIKKRLMNTGTQPNKQRSKNRFDKAVQNRMKKNFKDNSTHTTIGNIVTKPQDSTIVNRKKVGY